MYLTDFRVHDAVIAELQRRNPQSEVAFAFFYATNTDAKVDTLWGEIFAGGALAGAVGTPAGI